MSCRSRVGRARPRSGPGWTTLLIVGGLTAACVSSPAAQIRVRHLPPTKADVIEAFMRSHDIGASVHGSCSGFGTWEDQTMGRHLANLIASSDPEKVNWVEIRIVPRRAPARLYWRATVLFRIDLEGPDPYTGGADFLIRQSDGAVIPSSFACPGH